jgi:hypothetical protein
LIPKTPTPLSQAGPLARSEWERSPQPNDRRPRFGTQARSGAAKGHDHGEPQSNGQTAVSLGEFLDGEVLPRLTAEAVFTHEAHRFKKEPHKWRGGCPWHYSKSGTSFYIDPESLTWRCPACQVGGGPVQYVWQLQGHKGSPRGQDFVDAVRRLAQLAGVPFPQRAMTEEERELARKRDARRAMLEVVCRCCEEYLWSPDGEQARAYFHGRGFTDDHLRELRVGLYPPLPQMRHALEAAGFSEGEAREAGVLNPGLVGYTTWPWHDDRGRLLTLYGKWPGSPPEDKPKTTALPNPGGKGNPWERTKRSPLYLDRALRAGHKELVLVEGVTDAALAQILGDTRVIACVAAELSRLQVETLKRRGVESVIICLDPDTAGENGVESCIRQLLTAGITPYVAGELPDGLDPDDFILREGLDGWRAHVENAVHGFKWKAGRIAATSKPKAGWTDRSRDAALALARKFVAEHGRGCASTLELHFWPALASGLDMPLDLLRPLASKPAAGRNGTHDGTLNGAAATGISPPVPTWPDPPAREAYHGLAGEIVAALEPHSEADPVALLAQLLAGVGNCMGRAAHFRTEGDRHYLNEYVTLIGKTAKGRKGSSWGRIFPLLKAVDADWAEQRVLGGLSSGEGVIYHVRDPITSREVIKDRGRVVGHQDVETDPGVTDKRLLIYEPELASVLKRMEQQGNTLSALLRQAWETGNLGTLVKNNPTRATGAHISVIAHTTGEELQRYLTNTEMANGFGNRFLWLCVKRSKTLPDGGQPDEGELAELQGRLAQVVGFGRGLGEMRRDDKARGCWHEVYGPLSEGKPGLSGALLARGEAHVMRLACLYAVLDLSAVVRAEHLLAALALWDYVEHSVRFLFGESLGDPVADEILRLLRAAGEAGVSRTDISNHLGRHQQAIRISQALAVLLEHGLARMDKEETGGRPGERWRSTR